MKTMTASEAQIGFDRLLQLVASGEEVQITQHGHSVAKVVPLGQPITSNLVGSVLEEEDLISPISVRWDAGS